LLFLRSPAHDLENDQNPVIQRAARVRELLARLPLSEFADQDLVRRIQELQGLGFKNFDAFHLACAELGGAEVFATCDDRLLKAARREASRLRVRVENPLDLMKEVIP